MRLIYTLFLLLTFVSVDVAGQRKTLKLAQSHIDVGRYNEAIRVLQPLLSAEEVNREVYVLAGIAYLGDPGDSEYAITLFDKAIELYPPDEKLSRKALEARLFKAQALHLSHRFDEALKIERELLEITPATDKDFIAAINREIAYSENALKMIAEPVSFQIQSMGRAFNSMHNEHSPVVSVDESTIYFTSNRPLEGMNSDDGDYFESIYASYWRDGEWTAAVPVELPGSYYGNRATVSMSADGNTIVFYQNDGAIGNLHESRLVFGSWTEPTPLPPPVNSGSNESHASFSLDGDRIFFTSDRPGGYGGKDIYVSHKLPTGFWGTPLNLGPNVNTELDEDSPFLHPDGVTLYFSSEAHSSMGGHDLFFSRIDEEGKWSEPVNLGYPINTVYDDKFFLPTADGQRVYYASRQADGYGAMDIYLITFPQNDERSLAVVARHIFDEKGMPFSDVIVRIYDNENNLLQGEYRPNSLSGKFVSVLPTGKNYRMELEAEGYERYRETFRVEIREVYGTRSRAFYLEPIILKPLNQEDIDGKAGLNDSE